MTTALITHADGLAHKTPDGHPEQVARLEHVLHALQALDLRRITAREALTDELLRCHPQAYIDRIRAAEPAEGQHQLDEDTWMSPGSYLAASRAAGAACQAVDMVLGGEVGNAFCATRPPATTRNAKRQWGFACSGPQRLPPNTRWTITV